MGLKNNWRMAVLALPIVAGACAQTVVDPYTGQAYQQPDPAGTALLGGAAGLGLGLLLGGAFNNNRSHNHYYQAPQRSYNWGGRGGRGYGHHGYGW